MSLRRYVIIVFAANLILLSAVALLAPHSEPDPYWLWRSTAGGAGASLFVTWITARTAQGAAADQRASFWSYGAANRVWIAYLAFVGAGAFLIFSGVLHVLQVS